MRNRFTILLFLLCGGFSLVKAQTISNVITGLSNPYGVAIKGNDLYVSESKNGGRIVKANISGTNQPGTAILTLNTPNDMLFIGDDLYVNISTGIVKIDVTASTPVATTVLSGLSSSRGLLLVGDELYYSELSLNKVSKINLMDATPTPTIVVESNLTSPSGLAFQGNRMFIAVGNGINVITDITAATPTAVTFATSGLMEPVGLALNGDFLYTSVIGGLAKVGINDANPVGTLVAGISLVCPFATVFKNGAMYVADESAVKKIEGLAPSFNDIPPVCEGQTTSILGGASPTGGIYSGVGVVDNGNGETFTFDVGTQGSGTFGITYTLNMAIADAELTVVAAPNVSYTAGLSELFENAGVQTNLSGGTPTGGVYSGPGVTDNGNGMTYSFNPAVAGIGTHSIVYTYTDGNGCSDAASDMVVVKQALSFTDLNPVCANQPSSIQGGGTPAGGVYSGPGVSDNGNGQTFTFDVVEQGVGTHVITYTLGTGMVEAQMQVLTIPTVSFMTSLTELFINAGIQTDLGGGLPVGGLYSGPGVTDNGNGMTYDFDPSIAGAGSHTITYSFADGNGCQNSNSDMVVVKPLALDGDKCTDPIDINGLFGQMVEVPQITAQFNTTGYSSDATDPSTGFECHFQNDALQNTLWYSFTGDGERYLIRSIECSGSTANFDLQSVIYSGDCNNLTAVDCNEDEDVSANLFNIKLEVASEVGVNYLLMLDSYVGENGSFCLEITRLTDVAVVNINETELRIFPNPTNDFIQLPALKMERVEVYDISGRLVLSEKKPGNSLQLRNQPAGLYLLKMFDGENVYSAKVIKE